MLTLLIATSFASSRAANYFGPEQRGLGVHAKSRPGQLEVEAKGKLDGSQVKDMWD